MAARVIWRWSPLAAVALVVAPGADAQLNCNAGIEFHPGGEIRACRLNGEHRFVILDARPLTCADGERIELDPRGRVRRCTLAAPYDDGRRRCAQGSRVELSAGGDVERCDASG